LTLQVTQQCNLKCEYCPYSGGFYNRQHSNKKMSFEMAKKAIDYYILHSYDIPAAQIGFYGGEPLIEFELIKEIVGYVASGYYGKEVKYFITTNATLLTEDKIDFLMDNDFVLTISLDGPKQYHNKNRHKIDNSGSFDTVMENIAVLHRKYPDKKDNIQFNCVIDPKMDFKCLNDFFIREDNLKEYRVLYNSISREGMKEKDRFLPGT
ncbi:MAG: radical SAM protein, partial [Lachnospiraceae bacterium]|nr:radical SAM protein [Lachnospiraceae bacterium]